jgi:hypothetical protein
LSNLFFKSNFSQIIRDDGMEFVGIVRGFGIDGVDP